jgi:hypothetical protein
MRKRHLIAVGFSSLLAALGTLSTARAEWGCGSQAYSGGHFKVWAFPTEAEAKAAVLRLCGEQYNNCKASCRNHIDTEAQANKLWPLTSSNQVRCGNGTDKAC